MYESNIHGRSELLFSSSNQLVSAAELIAHLELEQNQRPNLSLLKQHELPYIEELEGIKNDLNIHSGDSMPVCNIRML